MFRAWLKSKSLGIMPVELPEFVANTDNAVLDAPDNSLMEFAKEKFGYIHDKGLDFIARFNKRYIIGEAKFLIDFGGHQNAQFNDAINTIQSNVRDAIKIAILYGVLYIKGNHKMYKAITNKYQSYNIMSALVLREFLNSL